MIGQAIDYTFYVRNRRDVRHTEIPEDSKRERQKNHSFDRTKGW